MTYISRTTSGTAGKGRRRFWGICLLISLAASTGASRERQLSNDLAAAATGIPGDETADAAPSIPGALRDAWLRFHEAELCQGVDAVFRWHGHGMEVWCVVEDEKTFQKLQELLQPLNGSFQVDLYLTRPVREKQSAEDRDPPPSIWNNAEIRNFLQDPFIRSGGGGGILVRPPPSSVVDSEYFLKQRMMMFAEQILEWEVKMKRYAVDLPELTDIAFSKSGDPELRSRAREITLAHAKGVNKYAEKLADNLTRALPKASRRFRSPEEAPRARRFPPPYDSAIQVAWGARSIARRVYRFVHPEQHTVGLIDLREPSLLESLRTLRRMVSDFETSVRSAR